MHPAVPCRRPCRQGCKRTLQHALPHLQVHTYPSCSKIRFARIAFVQTHTLADHHQALPIFRHQNHRNIETISALRRACLQNSPRNSTSVVRRSTSQRNHSRLSIQSSRSKTPFHPRYRNDRLGCAQTLAHLVSARCWRRRRAPSCGWLCRWHEKK